jgi:hypothetical protein
MLVGLPSLWPRCPVPRRRCRASFSTRRRSRAEAPGSGRGRLAAEWPHARALLDDMGQLMGQELPARTRRRIEPPGGKGNPGTDGVGGRANGSGGLRSRAVGIYAHSAEVVPEARLKIGSRRHVEQLPWRARHLMYNVGRLAGGWRCIGLFLKFSSPSRTAHLRLI